jgi:DNA transposition AAA+ family ATPase
VEDKLMDEQLKMKLDELSNIHKRLQELGINYVMVDGEVLYMSEKYKEHLESLNKKKEA